MKAGEMNGCGCPYSASLAYLRTRTLLVPHFEGTHAGESGRESPKKRPIKHSNSWISHCRLLDDIADREALTVQFTCHLAVLPLRFSHVVAVA